MLITKSSSDPCLPHAVWNIWYQPKVGHSPIPLSSVSFCLDLLSFTPQNLQHLGLFFLPVMFISLSLSLSLSLSEKRREKKAQTLGVLGHSHGKANINPRIL